MLHLRYPRYAPAQAIWIQTYVVIDSFIFRLKFKNHAISDLYYFLRDINRNGLEQISILFPNFKESVRFLEFS